MPARDNVPRSTPRKRGRPQAQHRKPDGTEVKGLSRQADGRWRISETGETFFEPDEHLAIARFEQVNARLRGQKTVNLPLPPQPGPEEARAAAIAAGATRVRAFIRRGQPPEYMIPIDSAAFWAEVRRVLLEDPRNVASKTGVEWVGRGADLPRPTPSPTMPQLIDTYAAKPGITGGRRRTGRATRCACSRSPPRRGTMPSNRTSACAGCRRWPGGRGCREPGGL